MKQRGFPLRAQAAATEEESSPPLRQSAASCPIPSTASARRSRSCGSASAPNSSVASGRRSRAATTAFPDDSLRSHPGGTSKTPSKNVSPSGKTTTPAARKSVIASRRHRFGISPVEKRSSYVFPTATPPSNGAYARGSSPRRSRETTASSPAGIRTSMRRLPRPT